MSKIDKKMEELDKEQEEREKKLEDLGLETKIVADVGMHSAIPMIGNLNILKVDMPDQECIFIITDLEPEQAFETYQGTAHTKYGEARGKVCEVTLKFRGHWDNFDKKGGKAEVFELLSCPYLIRRNVRVDRVGVNITDKNVELSWQAYDNSMGVKYRDAFEREHILHTQALDRAEDYRINVHELAQQIAASINDDTDMGVDAYTNQYKTGGSFANIWDWIMKNKILTIGIIAGLYFALTFFGVI